MLAEIPQLDTGWEVCACQGPRRVREQDLAAVARGRDPRDLVEGETYIVAADEGHLACVNAHPDPDRVALRPGVIREGPLSVDRGHDRRRGIRKCREDRVALRPDDAAAVAGDGLVEQGTVLVQQLAIGVTQLLDESGGALDVGEQEGDGARGQRPCSRRVDPRLGRRRGWAVAHGREYAGKKHRIGKVVGAAGFEPAISCSQSTCVTGLRYTPTSPFYGSRP